MLQIQDWWKIPQHKRDILIKKFSIKRSGVTSVRGVAPGIDQVVDDGVREGDIEPIRNYDLQQLIDIADGKYDVPENDVVVESVGVNDVPVVVSEDKQDINAIDKKETQSIKKNKKKNKVK